MHPDELKRLGNELASSLDKDGKPFFELKLQIGRLLSHIESEQRVTVAMDKQLQQHEKEIELHARALFGDKEDMEKHPGVITTLNILVEDRKKAGKMRMSILTTLVTLVIIEGSKLILTHTK